MNSETRWLLAGLAVMALLAGAVFYLLGRPPERVYLLAELLPAWRGMPGGASAFPGALPSFLHIFAFVLLTAALLNTRPWGSVAIAGGWFTLDALLEALQHPALADRLAPILPDWFGRVPILDNLGPYMTRGTFDGLDVAALALGAAAAFLTLLALEKGGRHGSQPMHPPAGARPRLRKSS